MGLCVYLNRQQTILERIACEDVRKIGADHRLKAEALKRPGRVLPGRSAAEVVSGQKNLRTFGFRLVQRKLSQGLAVGVETPVGEEIVAQALFVGRLEVACRDDLISIYILDRQRD